MAEYTEWLEKSNAVEKKRANEIWSTENGMLVCVQSHCMGMRMWAEVTSNIRRKKTSDGGYQLTNEEISYMRDFLIEEIGEKSPTCSCGRLPIEVSE